MSLKAPSHERQHRSPDDTGPDPRCIRSSRDRCLVCARTSHTDSAECDDVRSRRARCRKRPTIDIVREQPGVAAAHKNVRCHRSLHCDHLVGGSHPTGQRHLLFRATARGQNDQQDRRDDSGGCYGNGELFPQLQNLRRHLRADRRHGSARRTPCERKGVPVRSRRRVYLGRAVPFRALIGNSR